MAALQLSTFDVFREQCQKACANGDTEASIWLTEQLRAAQALTLPVGERKIILSFNDMGEDPDDIWAIVMFFLLMIGHKIVIVIVGGSYSSKQRWAYLKRKVHFLQNAEFGVPVHNDITFYSDDAELPDLQYDLVLNCAPTRAVNFDYFADKIKVGGRAVLVGAAADGGFTNAINQRYTDGVATKDTWDAFQEKLIQKSVVRIVLPTSVSRNVTFLNPFKVPDDHSSSASSLAKISPELVPLFIQTMARFVASRPYKMLPAQVIERINAANAHLCMRSFKHIIPKITPENLKTYEKFKLACVTNGVPASAYEAASVCFAVSDYLGAKYADEYAVDPTDHVGRETLPFIKDLDEFMANIGREATELMPAYDPCAICLGIASIEDLRRFNFVV